LKGLVRGGRVAHAYLFAGPSGIGKRLTALAFARTWLCERRGEEACEQCTNCLQNARGACADLQLVQRAEAKKEISIDQVREILRWLSFASVAPRIVVVDEAERMSEEAMNAHLKTLDEAPDRAVLILVTSVPSMILPTIRSRCQTILFYALAEKTVLRILGGDSPETRLAVALADGSVGRAKELLEELREWGTESAELIPKILSGDVHSIVEGIARIRDTAKARERGRRILQILALSLREALRARAGLGTTSKWPHDLEALADRIELLLDHESMIDRNVNVSLAVENALLRMG